MSNDWQRRKALLGILIPLVLAIIVCDQWSKAWFVYRLGTHKFADFGTFLGHYLALWGGVDGAGAVSAHFTPFKPGIHVWFPWIDFSLTTNTGAAWSMFSGNSFALSGVSLLMALLLFYVWWRSFRFHTSMTWALGGIIGGALGNFLDRFRLKEVVDFIDVRIPYIGRLFPALTDPYDFPIFNIADSCAVVGTLALAAYLIVADIRALRRRHHHQHGAEAAVAAVAAGDAHVPAADWDPALERGTFRWTDPGTTDGPVHDPDPPTPLEQVLTGSTDAADSQEAETGSGDLGSLGWDSGGAAGSGSAEGAGGGGGDGS